MTNNYLWLNSNYKIKWIDQDSNLQGRKGRVSIWGTRKILLGCRQKTKKVLSTNLVQSLETRVVCLLLLFCLFVSGSQKRPCRTGRDTQSFRTEAGQLTGIFRSESIQIPCLSFASVYLRTWKLKATSSAPLDMRWATRAHWMAVAKICKCLPIRYWKTLSAPWHIQPMQ